jgi:hypothetical protein
MKLMSDYITKLEGFTDLEVSIIRKTKINKVLKAILKLESIPKEDEFQFKPRSQTLLEKWNKLLAVDPSPAEGGAGDEPAPAGAAEKTNGVNGTASEPSEPKEAKEPKATNGVKVGNGAQKGSGKESAAKADVKAPEKAAEKAADADTKTEAKPTATSEEVRLNLAGFSGAQHIR